MRLVMVIFYGYFLCLLFGQEFENCFIDFLYIVLFSGVFLKFGFLFEEVVNNVDLYFCCLMCGKVFWEGKYYKRVNVQFVYFLENF